MHVRRPLGYGYDYKIHESDVIEIKLNVMSFWGASSRRHRGREQRQRVIWVNYKLN